MSSNFFKADFSVMDVAEKVQSINNYDNRRREIHVLDVAPAILTDTDSLNNRVSGDGAMNACVSIQKHFHDTCLQRTRMLRARD